MPKRARVWTIFAALVLAVSVGAGALLWPVSEETPPTKRTAPVEIRPVKAAPANVAPADTEAPALSTDPWRPEKATFAVRYDGLDLPYRVIGLFLMPGQTATLEVARSAAENPERYLFHADRGRLATTGPAQWRWTAPERPGLYPLTITRAATGETMRLNAFVMTPFDHQSRTLQGYRIGRYEEKPYTDNPAYLRPEGFVEITPENENVRVSPHFTLGQFQCKQAGGFPKYQVLEERLLLKLELLLEKVNRRGIETRTLHVMSGFRTPWYNKSIGNDTEYSRHLYGGASDVFVDADGDDYMDDLDGDGEVTRADAAWLAGLLEEETSAPEYAPFVGGLGIYSPAPHRGPFIHVDVRGWPARW